jgi:hypothetical protein
MNNPNKYVLPKILIGIPTYEGKNYCLDAFMNNVNDFTYPKSNIEIYVADNSISNENALMIRDKYKVKTFWKDYEGVSVMEKLADSHNQIRRYFLESDADYLLHLESDIFPPNNVIEELLWARKPIVTSLYQIFDGANRNPCIRIWDKKTIHYKDFQFDYELFNFPHWWVDGTIKEVLIGGIGCTLMHKKVMKNFQFRCGEKNEESNPPDTYFAIDLRNANVINWVHTGLLSFHWNREEWGRNFNYINYLKSE